MRNNTFFSMVLAYPKTCWLEVLEVFYNEVLWLSGPDQHKSDPFSGSDLCWSLQLLSVFLAENFSLHKFTHTLRFGLSPIKIPKQISENSPSISKEDPHHWTKHTSLAFQICLLHWSRCLSRKLFNANHLSFQLGPKPEVRPAQTDLETVQIFYIALRNNISFMQLYRPISICIHAWVVLGYHVINFGEGNEVY